MKRLEIFKGSVATKTILLVIVIVTLIMLSAGFLQTKFIRSYIGDDVHRNASRSIENAIKIIDARIGNVETAVNTAAAYADNFVSDEEDVYTLLQDLIEANEDIEAVTVMYSADYFPHHGRYFAPTIFRNHTDNVLERDEIGGPDNDFCYIETDSNWIYTQKLDHGYWCTPYTDSISTKRAMVSYSVPIHNNLGETFAVLCADVDLNWMQTIVEEAKPYNYAEVFVISNDSQFVSHPDKDWIQTVNIVKEAQKMQDAQQIRLVEQMIQRQRGYDTMDASVLRNPSAKTSSHELSSVFYAPIGRVKWALCYTIPEKNIMKIPNSITNNILLLLVVMLVFISSALYFIIHRQLRPMKQLAKSTQDVAKGNFNAQLPVVTTHDEIRLLRDSFEEMQLSLVNYIEELKQTTAKKASIESELKVAADIQMSMVPRIFPPFPERKEIDLYASMTPAKEVGGDLYNFLLLDEHLYFCVGDVSGKGVPASLFMAQSTRLFRTLAGEGFSPEAIANRMNSGLCEGNDTMMFVTMFIGMVNLQTGQLDFCNCGHNPPVLDGRFIEFRHKNRPLGLFDDLPFQGETIDDIRGKQILIYTDGLNEAMNRQSEQFGNERLLEMMKNTNCLTSQQVIDILRGAVEQHRDGADPNDDLTILCLHLAA